MRYQFRLLGFGRDKLKDIHEGGSRLAPKDTPQRSRPWKRALFTIAALATLSFGGYAAQTETGKQTISTYTASYAPDSVLRGVSNHYGSEMAGYLARAQAKQTEVDAILHHNTAYKRLLATAEPDQRAAIVAAFVSQSSKTGLSLLDAQAVAGSTAVLLESWLNAGSAAEAADQQALLLNLAAAQPSGLMAQLAGEAVQHKLEGGLSAPELTRLTQILPLLQGQEQAETVAAALIQTLQDAMAGATPAEQLTMAEAFARHATPAQMAALDEDQLRNALSPLLSYYLTTHDRVTAERINSQAMERLEQHASKDFVANAYQRIVMETTASLEDAELADLDHKPASIILNWLVVGYYGSQDMQSALDARKQIERHYAHVGLDPAFLEHFRPMREKWYSWVQDNAAELDDVSARWAEMDTQERLDALSKYVTIHSEIFGFKAPPLSTYDCTVEEPDAKYCPDLTWAVAFYSPSEEGVWFNAGLSYWNDFEQMLSTAIHENVHNHQGQMAKMYREGKIDAGHAIEDQAALFAWSIYYYINYDFKLYQRHPWERQAWWSQRELQKVRDTLSPYWKNLINNGPPATTGRHAEKHPDYADGVYHKAPEKSDDPIQSQDFIIPDRRGHNVMPTPIHARDMNSLQNWLHRTSPNTPTPTPPTFPRL